MSQFLPRNTTIYFQKVRYLPSYTINQEGLFNKDAPTCENSRADLCAWGCVKNLNVLWTDSNVQSSWGIWRIKLVSSRLTSHARDLNWQRRWWISSPQRFQMNLCSPSANHSWPLFSSAMKGGLLILQNLWQLMIENIFRNICIFEMCPHVSNFANIGNSELEVRHMIWYYVDSFSVSETGRNPVTGLDHCNRELAKLLSNSSYSIQVKINSIQW